jgi:hypothetical protein
MKVRYSEELEDIGVIIEHANMMPKPYKEITGEEAQALMFCGAYGIRSHYHSQIFLGWEDISVGYNQTSTEGMWSLDVYRYLTYAVGVLTKYDTRYPRHDHLRQVDKGLGIFVTKEDGENPYGHFIRFYRIGCEHDWSTSTQRMFEHTSVCKKCGFKYGYDSSG